MENLATVDDSIRCTERKKGRILITNYVKKATCSLGTTDCTFSETALPKCVGGTVRTTGCDGPGDIQQGAGLSVGQVRVWQVVRPLLADRNDSK